MVAAVAADPLYERRTDESRGRHLVATSRIEKGRLLLCERPILVQQNLSNVRDAWVCHNCCTFVGNADAAMRHRFEGGEGDGDESGSDDNPSTGGDSEAGPDPLLSSSPVLVVVPCRHQCGYAYCSSECEQDAYVAHHRWLCTGTVESPDHPLVRFKMFAAETNEILLAAAQWWVVQHTTSSRTTGASTLSSESTAAGNTPSPYTDFVMEPWWDVSVLDLVHGKDPGGFAEAIQVQRAQREICDEAADLLNQALAASRQQQDEKGAGEDVVVFPPISAMGVARRLGSFSQNAIGFRRRHPLCRDVFDVDFRRRWHRQIVTALEEAGFLGDCQDDDDDDNDDKNEDEGIAGGADVDAQEDAMDARSEGDGDANADVDADDLISLEEVATLLSELFVDEDGTVLETNQTSPPSVDGKEKEQPRVRDTTGDDLDYIFPPLDGTALYSITCKMNHSCDPNVIVLFKRTGFGRMHPLVAHCVALRDIAEDEELTISYIENDRPYEERQLALSSYGFTCHCAKCKTEESSEHPVTPVVVTPATPEEDLFGSDAGDDDGVDDDVDGDVMANDAAEETGESALEQLLERLDSRSNSSQFGSIPLAMAARVLGFIVQLGTSRLEQAELQQKTESHVVASILSTCVAGASERDYCLCRVSGSDLERHLYNELKRRGRFSDVTHRQAYWCSVLAAAVGYAHEGRFLEAMAFLDKGIVLGLSRDDHSLFSFVNYVEYFARQMAVGPVPPSWNAVIPNFQSTENRKRAEDVGLGRAPGNAISECRTQLSFDDFRSEFLNSSQPVVVRGYASNWSAIDAMRDLRPLAHQHGHRLVPVEIGSIINGTTGVKDSTMKEELMTVRAFVESFLLASTDHGVWSLADAINRPGVAYMAQHALLGQIRDLAGGVALHPNLCGPSGPDRVNAWIGTGGTRTPLHFDSYDNLLVQLVGAKYVRLYSADAAAKLPRLVPVDGESGSYGLQGNMSSLNCELEEADDVKFTDTLLFPGDCLYIPSGVWHYVRSLATSVSVNYWFTAP